jgi:hypothetical protein
MFPSSSLGFALERQESEWKTRKGMESFEMGPKDPVK